MGAGDRASLESNRPRWWATELGARIASAVVLGISALVAAYAGGWLFALFWLAAGVAILVEWINMTRAEPRLPLQAVFGATLAILTVLYIAEARTAAFLLVAGVAMAAAAALSRGSRNRLWSIAGFLYAAVIALVPPVVRDHPELGLVGLLWMFAVVWTTDVAAYFTGRRLGGPKLWPRVSPKKTWSGFVGGLAAGTLSGVLVDVLAESLGWAPPAPLVVVALVSAAASVASQGGDLAESALKRRFDVKDSSHLIPGHGGVMDRLDGFWAVAVLLGAALLLEPLA
ncbi:MAG TPA: phosphatidate cytidylyltransferase [Microvirga sp.]|nr:phosphatidate cytidylyltransferase [Microvirga sp.]